MKVDSSYYGIEINLGQHGSIDFSYDPVSFSTLIQNASTFSFWRVGLNTTIPATQGNIIIMEI